MNVQVAGKGRIGGRAIPSSTLQAALVTARAGIVGVDDAVVRSSDWGQLEKNHRYNGSHGDDLRRRIAHHKQSSTSNVAHGRAEVNTFGNARADLGENLDHRILLH
jgi:hypothetical protein